VVKITQRTSEASRGGFQNIKKVRGLITSIKDVPPPDGWETDKLQIKGEMEDAVILERFEEGDDFELKDGKFSWYWGYGLTPEDAETKNSPAYSAWMKGAVASAEKMGKIPENFVGTVATIDKQEVVLFSTRPKKDEDGNEIPKGEDGKYPKKDITMEIFCFVPDEDSDSENFKTYAAEQLDGLGQKAAKRKLITDTRLKQMPELKDKLNDGTLAEYLDMEVVEGKFVNREG
jgi:hypothetical protein